MFGTERELEGIIRKRGAQGLLVATDDDPAGTSRARRADLQTGRRENVPAERQGGAIRRGCHVRGARPDGPQCRAPREPETSSSQRACSDAMHVLGSDPCPSCGSREVYRSKARTALREAQKSPHAEADVPVSSLRLARVAAAPRMRGDGRGDLVSGPDGHRYVHGRRPAARRDLTVRPLARHRGSTRMMSCH